MDTNILGILLSYVFVFSTILIATLIQKSFKLSSEFSRKIIHIVVGNWVFLALYYFNDWRYAIVGPVSFIVINYISYRYTIFKAMELDEDNPGTVYYSASLTVLTLLTFLKPNFYLLPFLGMMAMTWGDGFAAIIGKKMPLKLLRKGRSLGGSSAFVIFSFFACTLYLYIQKFPANDGAILLLAAAFSLTGALIELFSPHKLDNLTVPVSLGILGIFVEKMIL
ncbi:hypothetical protein GF337_00705 [candidate division KSB1 bacterium]|nr:hypothetical protein [candidate division KSB1 bacterium]